MNERRHESTVVRSYLETCKWIEVRTKYMNLKLEYLYAEQLLYMTRTPIVQDEQDMMGERALV